MKKGFFFQILLMVAVIGMAASALAAEKVRYGTSMKTHPLFALPLLAAEEKGLWKKNGLEVEWVAFNSGSDMFRGVAAGSLDVGMTGTVSEIQAASRGIPVIVIADPGVTNDFFIWVRADSRLKEPRDLKGARVSVSRFGGVSHAYARVALKALGLENQAKIVAAGGVREEMGSLRAGHTDGSAMTLFEMTPLWARGEVSPLLKIRDYLPREWSDNVLYARLDFAEKNPEAVRQAVKVFLQAGDYIMKEKAWAIEQMKTFSGFPEEGARKLYEGIKYSKEGKINPKALENVNNFLMEYGIIAKALPVEALYSAKFTE